jgi:hypothetical protein
MIEITLEKPKPKIVSFDLSDIRSNKYYGIKMNKSEMYKGFITTEKFEGTYVIRCLNGLTIGNGWEVYENHRNLKNMIQYLLEERGQVFEFETYQELVTWLLE